MTNEHTKSATREVRTRSLSSLWNVAMQSRRTVLLTLFLITGALGLPLLWYSPAFSSAEKTVWSAAVMAYTAALVGFTAAVVYWCYRVIVESF